MRQRKKQGSGSLLVFEFQPSTFASNGANLRLLIKSIFWNIYALFYTLDNNVLFRSDKQKQTQARSYFKK